MRSSLAAGVVFFVLLLPAHSAEPEWRFRGYFVLGGEDEFVSLQTANAKSRWFPIGAKVADHRILRLDRVAGTVTLRTPNGEERVVPLEAATVGQVALQPVPLRENAPSDSRRMKLPTPATPRGPVPPEVARAGEIVEVFPAPGQTPSAEGLDWAWIQSDDNPMRKAPTLPSIAESSQWSKLTPAQRADLVELYRQCGWALTVYVRRNGLVATNIAPLPRPTELAPQK